MLWFNKYLFKWTKKKYATYVSCIVVFIFSSFSSLLSGYQISQSELGKQSFVTKLKKLKNVCFVFLLSDS